MGKYHQDKVIGVTLLRTSKTVTYGGKKYKSSPDFYDLPDCNFEDPEFQKWFQESKARSIKRYRNLWFQESKARSIKRYGNLTVEEFEHIVKVKDGLVKTKLHLTRRQAFDMAWEKVMKRKLPQEIDLLTLA